MGHPTASQTHNAVVKKKKKILERLDKLEKKLDELKEKKNG